MGKNSADMNTNTVLAQTKEEIMQNPLKQPQLINLVWFYVLIALLLNSLGDQDKFMGSILV